MKIQQLSPEVNYEKLIKSVSLDIQNVPLRTSLREFLDSIKPKLLTSPASSSLQYHHAYPGGLLQHINEVIQLGSEFLGVIFGAVNLGAGDLPINIEDLVVAAVLHDIHKVVDPFGRDYYVPHLIRASKSKNDLSMKRSEKKPYAQAEHVFKCRPYTDKSTSHSSTIVAMAELIDRNLEQLPEGELSLMLIHTMHPMLYSQLSPRTVSTIRYHEGAYGPLKSQLRGKETPVLLALHTADMVSSRAPQWMGAGASDSEE